MLHRLISLHSIMLSYRSLVLTLSLYELDQGKFQFFGMATFDVFSHSFFFFSPLILVRLAFLFVLEVFS